MVRLRKVVFYLFSVAYLVTCPLTILYAFGVLFRPESSPNLVRTGVISIATIPPGANIWLNGALLETRSAAVLRELPPGPYAVRLTRARYQPWTRRVTVEPGRATVLEDLLLTPRQRQPRLLTQERFEQLRRLADGLVLLYSPGEMLLAARLFDTQSHTLQPLAAGAAWPQARLINVIAPAQSTACLLTVQHQRRQRYLWWEPEQDARDVTPFISHPPRQIAWDPAHPHVACAFYDEHVDCLHPQDQRAQRRVFEHIRGGGVFAQRLIVVTAQGRLLARSLDHAEGRVTALAQPPPGWLSALQGAVQLFWMDAQTCFIRDERGLLGWTRAPYTLVPRGVRGVAAHPQDAIAAIWTQHRLGVLACSPAATDAPSRVRWLVEDARDITDVFWAVDGRYLVYGDREDIYVLQLWHTTQPDRVHVARAQRGSQAAWPKGGMLYYLDQATRRLAAVELIPPTALPALPGPMRDGSWRQETP